MGGHSPFTTNESNKKWLEIEFTESEIFHSVHSCDGMKAPVSDGFHFRFVKKVQILPKYPKVECPTSFRLYLDEEFDEKKK